MNRRTIRSTAALATIILTLTLAPIATQPAAADPPSIVDTVTTSHPRLLMDADGFAAAADRIDTDPQVGAWFDSIQTTGDALLTQPAVSYSGTGGMLEISRTVLSRVYTLGFLYQVTDDDDYAARLWTELNAAAQFAHWNPAHFLDTAEMTHAFAIGYDWAFDYFSPSQRDTIAQAIVDKGFAPGLVQYRTQQTWTVRTDNWNIVCNSGLALGALALAQDEPVLGEEILQSGLASVPAAFPQYAPDGGYIEGISYWGYATKYLTAWAKAFETATGDDHGLFDVPGFDQTALFPVYLGGPSGQAVNFSDSGPELQQIPDIAMYGDAFDDPIAQWWALEGTKIAATSPMNVLFSDPSAAQSPQEAGLPLDHTFNGPEISTMRSGWGQGDALFASLKGGTPGGHADLDQGSFVLDALGVRWAKDFGPEDYNVAGYWDVGAEGTRWDYFRKRAEGHNTLSINPGQGPDENPLATTAIVRDGSDLGGAFAIADLTAARSSEVTTWHRGVRLFDDRRRVVVQDEIVTDDPVDAWWSMHTDATIAITSDGRSATLTLDGEQLLARIASPVDATFTDLDAEALWMSPYPEGQASNTPSHKLAVHVATDADVTISVELTPLRAGQSAPLVAPVTALDDWVASTATPATLDSLSVDGTPLTGFDDGSLVYDVLATESSSAPTVTATGHDGATVTIEQANEVPGAATVTVSKDGHAITRYHVYFRPGAGTTHVSGQLTVTTVSATKTDAGLPANTTDGIRNTRWGVNTAGPSIRYDLGSAQTVETVSVAWRDVAKRDYGVAIDTSVDGTTWTPAYTGTSAGGDADGWEHYVFTPTSARFVRITAAGGSAGTQTTIDEVRILNHAVTPRLRPLSLDRIELGTLPATIDIGTSETVTATTYLNDDSVADPSQATVSFGVSDPAIATLSPAGELTAVSEGTVTVWAIGQAPDGRLVHSRTTVEVIDPLHRSFPAVADTFVRDGTFSNDNYGTGATLLAKKASAGYLRNAYIDFGTLDLPAENIQSAVVHLRAKVNDAGQPGTSVQIRESSVFSESTTTFATAPAPGAVLGSAAVAPTATTVSIDITAYAAARVAADEPITIAAVEDIARENGYGVLIDSSEANDASVRPTLEVTLGEPQPVLVSRAAQADAFIRDGSYANQNGGGSQTLLAKKASSGFLRQTLMSFDLSDVPAERVLSATLTFNATVNENTAGGTSTAIDVMETSSFGEMTVTYANAPAAGTLIGTVPVVGLTMAPVSIDATAFVTARAGASLDADFFLMENTTLVNGYGAAIASREAGDSTLRPMLLIELEP